MEEWFKQYLHPLINYLQFHPMIGLMIAFAFSLAESLPIIGTIVPGSVTMTAIGTLIGSGVLSSVPTFTVAILGAFLGDSIGFFLGRKYDKKIPNIWPFKKHPNWLESCEKFFKKHGGKSIVVGRFVGPMRSAVPLVAGILKLSPLRFFSAAIPSAIMWAFVYMMPGVLLGALSLEIPPSKMTAFLVGGLVFIVFLWFVFWAIQRSFRYLLRFTDYAIHRLWKKGRKRHTPTWAFQIISRKHSPSNHRQLILALCAATSGSLFVILFIFILLFHHLNFINNAMFHLMQSFRTPKLDRIMVMFTFFGQAPVILAMTVIMAAGFYLKKLPRTFWHWGILVVSTVVLAYGFKMISHSPRPAGFFKVASTSSFPSGHTTMSVCFYSFIVYLFAEKIKRNWRWIPYTLLILLLSAIAISRLYLGAHWLTDVIGSTLLAVSIVCSILLSFRTKPAEKNYSAKFMAILFLFAALIPWSVFCYKKLQTNIHHYAPKQILQSVQYQQWWNSPSQLPEHRLSRLGHPSQPLNLQWAGKLRTVKQTLETQGWTGFEKRLSLKGSIMRLSSTDPAVHTPVLPLLYQNQDPVITLYHRVKDKRSILEIRLWRSNWYFSDRQIPLWIGTVNFHMPLDTLLTLKRSHNYTTVINGAVAELNAELQADVNKTQWLSRKITPSDKSTRQGVTLMVIRPADSPTAP